LRKTVILKASNSFSDKVFRIMGDTVKTRLMSRLVAGRKAAIGLLGAGGLFFSCSAGEFKNARTNLSEQADGSGPQSASGLANPDGDKRSEAAGDADATAIPPQPITGAYLVCAEIDLTTSEDPLAAQLKSQVKPDEAGIACGVHDKKGKKLSGDVALSGAQVSYSDGSSRNTKLSEAPGDSAWHGSFVESKTKTLTIKTISVGGEIDGENFSVEIATPSGGEINAAPSHTLFTTQALFAISPADLLPPVFKLIDILTFSGLTGADEACASAALAADLPGAQWAAIMVSEASKNLTQRITLSMPIRNVKGDLIADYSEGDTIGSLSMLKLAPSMDEHGNLVGEGPDTTRAWTGLAAGGTGVPELGGTCADWTNNTSTAIATVGSVAKPDLWLSDGTKSCSDSAHLLCISQPVVGAPSGDEMQVPASVKWQSSTEISILK
jgi:hypothetical protein